MYGNKHHIMVTLEKITQVLDILMMKTRDAFIPKKPFNSWILNETTCQWEAPVAKPDDDQRYNWNETNQSWDLVE
jgi:hypothetical protein